MMEGGPHLGFCPSSSATYEEAFKPPGSVAVIVTDASPGASARTVTLAPDIEAVATEALDPRTLRPIPPAPSDSYAWS